MEVARRRFWRGGQDRLPGLRKGVMSGRETVEDQRWEKPREVQGKVYVERKEEVLRVARD